MVFKDRTKEELRGTPTRASEENIRDLYPIPFLPVVAVAVGNRNGTLLQGGGMKGSQALIVLRIGALMCHVAPFCGIFCDVSRKQRIDYFWPLMCENGRSGNES